MILTQDLYFCLQLKKKDGTVHHIIHSLTLMSNLEKPWIHGEHEEFFTDSNQSSGLNPRPYHQPTANHQNQK